jgi:hypothetical protein
MRSGPIHAFGPVTDTAATAILSRKTGAATQTTPTMSSSRSIAIRSRSTRTRSFSSTAGSGNRMRRSCDEARRFAHRHRRSAVRDIAVPLSFETVRASAFAWERPHVARRRCDVAHRTDDGQRCGQSPCQARALANSRPCRRLGMRRGGHRSDRRSRAQPLSRLRFRTVARRIESDDRRDKKNNLRNRALPNARLNCCARVRRIPAMATLAAGSPALDVPGTIAR